MIQKMKSEIKLNCLYKLNPLLFSHVFEKNAEKMQCYYCVVLLNGRVTMPKALTVLTSSKSVG